MKKKKKNTKKLDKFIIFMTVALIALLIVWVIKDNHKIDNNKQTEIEEIDYLKSFNKVSLEEAIKLLDNQELTFIYIGYEGCGACESFIPKLYDVAKEYDLKVNYMNYKSIETTSQDWKTFTNKLTKTQTLNIKIDEEDTNTDSSTKKIGEYLYNEGYTPTFIVFKNGKMIDGHIGGMSRANLRTFLNDAGYTKK